MFGPSWPVVMDHWPLQWFMTYWISELSKCELSNNKYDMIQFAAWIVIWLSPSTNFKQKRGVISCTLRVKMIKLQKCPIQFEKVSILFFGQYGFEAWPSRIV